MKRFVIIMAVLLTIGATYAADIQQISTQDEYPTGLKSFATKVNANFNGMTNGTISLIVSNLTASSVTAAAYVTNNVDASYPKSLTVGNSLTVNTNASVGGTLGVTGKTTLTGGLGGTGWVVTNTFAAGVYTTRLFYATGNLVTNVTVTP